MSKSIQQIRSFKPYLWFSCKKDGDVIKSYHAHVLVDIPDKFDNGSSVNVNGYVIKIKEPRGFQCGEGSKITFKLHEDIDSVRPIPGERLVRISNLPHAIYEVLDFTFQERNGDVSLEIFIDGVDLPPVQGSTVVNYDDADED